MKLENKIPKEFYFRKTKMVCNTLKFAQNLFVIHQYLVQLHQSSCNSRQHIQIQHQNHPRIQTNVVEQQHLVHKLNFLDQAPNSNPAQGPHSQISKHHKQALIEQAPK